VPTHTGPDQPEPGPVRARAITPLEEHVPADPSSVAVPADAVPAELPAPFTGLSAEQFLGEFNIRLGLRYLEISPERVVGTIPVVGNRQPYGLIHGGANATLAETLGSTAAVLNAPDGYAAMGLELSCTHHRAATEGLVTGVCTPLHTGRTVASYEIVLTDERGRRTCTARLTCVLRPTPPAGQATPR
jgi:1,4-dihydroxy-2-naphthoyl-CoA hydrolase